MTNDKSFLEAALLRTMTLLASLNAAAEITFGMRERKAGRDPSFDEHASVALPVLQEELQSLKTLAFQLQSSIAIARKAAENQVQGEETGEATGEPSAEPVNRFIDLMRLQKAGSALQSIHQRLLSLYPAVDEDLAEEARVLKNTADELKDCETEHFLTALSTFVDEVQLFTHRLADTAQQL